MGQDAALTGCLFESFDKSVFILETYALSTLPQGKAVTTASQLPVPNLNIYTPDIPSRAKERG